MNITREQLKELNQKGEVEIRVIECGKEFWETLELEE